MPKTTHTYTNNEVTIVWKPEACIHSRICWTGLIEVFNPRHRPWVNMSGAGTQTIIDQVKKCPSGALSYFMNDDSNEQKAMPEETAERKIEIQQNGPILISNDCVIRHSDGREELKKGTTALCRCGASGNKPFCDGSHKTIEFKG